MNRKIVYIQILGRISCNNKTEQIQQVSQNYNMYKRYKSLLSQLGLWSVFLICIIIPKLYRLKIILKKL